MQYNMNELQQKFELVKENIKKEQEERKQKDKKNTTILKQVKIVEMAEAKALKEKIKLNKLLEETEQKSDNEK